MNCINCGAFLTDKDLDYCPSCGFNVLIQKKADYLSKSLYNQGLEKASIRDLSGAIACLKQSLIYNKRNIQARNLLGLVYFETGEVVAALSEWVISKNLQPSRNLASDYIARLQANGNKLKIINVSIRKYNDALLLCREGHDDMAAIQLRRVLSQNPKLIKGYHLLALIHMKNHEWNRARRILKKASRIDKTNTTTLRFLREVEEQTGVPTRLEKPRKKLLQKFFRSKETEYDPAESEFAVQTPVYRERARLPVFLLLMSGMAAGAIAFWLLAVPAIRQGIYKEANEQIVQYSESLATQGAELTKVQGEAQESGATAEAVTEKLNQEQAKSQSYEALMTAYSYYLQERLDEAAMAVKNVQVDVLSDSMKSIYVTVRDATGVSGIGDEEQPQEDADSEDSGYDDSSYDDESYDDGSYDDGSYDDDSYDDGSYDDGYYEEY